MATQTLAEFRRWCATAPPRTTVDVAELAAVLGSLETDPEPQAVPAVVEAPLPWRVLLWSAPAETRIGKAELLEALGRSEHWLYRHTHSKAKDRIPSRRFYGELQFVVGEVREWLREREELVSVGPTDGAYIAIRRERAA